MSGNYAPKTKGKLLLDGTEKPDNKNTGPVLDVYTKHTGGTEFCVSGVLYNLP